MIHEHALLSITPGREAEFEQMFAASVPQVFAQSPGFVSIELHRSAERPSVFLLRVGWESVEAHTVEFRESPLFAEWRALAGPFFAEPPSVEHFSQAV